jgi:myosin heavy subunit
METTGVAENLLKEGAKLEDLDNALFSEAKRSARLHQENENLKRTAVDEFQRLQDAQKMLITETNALRIAEDTARLEVAKSTPLENTLASVKGSIESLQNYLAEIDAAMKKLAEHERSRDEAFSELLIENDACRMKISALEDKICRTFEEKKLVQLERKAAEEDLRRQRVETVESITLLQQECGSINAEIKSLNKDIRRMKSEDGVGSGRKLQVDLVQHSPVLRERFVEVRHAEGNTSCTHRVQPVDSGPKLQSKKLRQRDPRNLKRHDQCDAVTEAENLEGIIGEIVDSKLYGLESLVLSHVQRRFQSLENEIYIQSVPFPVYKGVSTKPMNYDEEVKKRLLVQLTNAAPAVADHTKMCSSSADFIPSTQDANHSVCTSAILIDAGEHPSKPGSVQQPQAPSSPRPTKKIGVGLSRNSIIEGKMGIQRGTPQTTAQTTPQSTPPAQSPRISTTGVGKLNASGKLKAPTR